MKIEQVSTATTKELIAFYNKNCECFGKKPVTKFSDRMTAEIRVKTMIEDIETEAAEYQKASQPSTLAVCLGLAPAPYITEGMKVSQAVAESVMEDMYDGYTHCPHCGIHLSNGVGLHNDEVNGKKIKHEKFELCCLACNEEFGPEIKVKREVKSTGEVREAMKTSLKLDRTIAAYDKEMVLIGTWKNAYRMWKDNPEWMTSAQQDTLTAKLYKAAKQGERISVTINDRTFGLVNV